MNLYNEHRLNKNNDCLISEAHSLKDLSDHTLVISFQYGAKHPVISRFIKDLNPLICIYYSSQLICANDVNRIFEQVRDLDIKRIIAIGGGSVMDMAKSIKMMLNTGESIYDLIRSVKVDFQDKIDLVCVPTTTGTGSEATQFAVIFDQHQKFSLDHPSLLPNKAILDSDLTSTLPHKVKVSAILDSFAQLIESFWAKKATFESKRFAFEGLSLLKQSGFFEGRINDHEKLQLASYFSGKAINITRTTLAHALSYQLTEKYGISHGTAVFYHLPLIAEYNFEEKSVRQVMSVLSCRTPDDFHSLCNYIMKIYNVSSFNFLDYDIDELLSLQDQSGRASNNPREYDLEELKQVYISRLNLRFEIAGAL